MTIGFTDLAAEYADITASPAFIAAFGATTDYAIYSPHDEPSALDLPEPEQAQGACTLIMATIFDLFRDTRLDPYAERAAWGFVHSFHRLAETIGFAEERAGNEVRKRVRRGDASEIGTAELEKAQLLARSLTEARAAMEAIRDHAAEIFRIETGRPWAPAKGSKVSSVMTASRIDSLDYLRAVALEKRDRLKPEGPAVIFSGGQQWEDWQLLYDRLDAIRTRIPHMILHTTAQRVGCDAIAAAWAANRGVPLIAWNLRRAQGSRAGFLRNDALLRLRPVEAIVCEGSGVQKNLAQKLREGGVPLHIFRLTDQRVTAVDPRIAAFSGKRRVSAFADPGN